MKYPVIVRKAQPSGYSASSPDVAGCLATGKTVNQAIGRFRTALALHLAALKEVGGEVPLPSTIVATVDVEGVA